MPRLTLARPFVAALGGVVLLTVCCLSPLRPGGSPRSVSAADGKVIAPGDLDLTRSRVYVLVGKAGLGHDHAVIGGFKSGALQLGANQNAGDLVFDLTSFRADDEAARKYVGLKGAVDAGTRSQVDANMLGPAVLNTARFATARLQVTSAAAMPKNSQRGLPQYKLSGELTLHGVTRPIVLVADAESQQGWIRLRGTCAFNQTAFGIRPFTKAFGAVGVADTVTVWGDLWIAGSAAPESAKPPRQSSQ